MSTQDAFLTSLQSDCRRLLAAYLANEQELRLQAARKGNSPACSQPDAGDSLADDEDESAIGWVPRLTVVEGVSEGRLGPLHGKLIALGLLKFQLTGRSSGIFYRLSAEGRAELARSAETQETDWRAEQTAA